jgi:2-polyprenyl-3-methyl-5-hydroxy-6-metoxy-1,4-benzoquinol methylase
VQRINGTSPISNYLYPDVFREDILRMVPCDGHVIGSVGCGFGNLEGVLVTAGREVHGVDISEEAIKVARTRLTTARVVSPEERMPFPKGSLDGLILADVIEHMPMAWEYLESFAQMLKPGGWVLISVPNMRNIEVLMRLVFHGDWPEHPMGIFDRTHIQFMTHRRLKRWAAQAGLSLDHWVAYYHYLFLRRNIYRVVDRLTFGIFKSFLTFMIQGVFRLPHVPPTR